MELSNILSECRRNTGKETLRELNSKILQGEHTGSPSLRLPSALVQFRKSVSIYPRSAPTCILFATRLVLPAIFLTLVAQALLSFFGERIGERGENGTHS